MYKKIFTIFQPKKKWKGDLLLIYLVKVEQIWVLDLVTATCNFGRSQYEIIYQIVALYILF